MAENDSEPNRGFLSSKARPFSKARRAPRPGEADSSFDSTFLTVLFYGSIIVFHDSKLTRDSLKDMWGKTT